MSTSDRVVVGALIATGILILACLAMIGYSIGRESMCRDLGGLLINGFCAEVQGLRP